MKTIHIRQILVPKSDRSQGWFGERLARVLQVTILGVLLFCVLSLRAQFRSTQWTADSGLPQNIIRGIVQTPDGYLWVATLNGVARFDGVRFTVFDKSNTPGIAGNRFAAMVHGVEGDLWLYTENGNITRYHNHEFHTLGASEGITPDSAHGITADNQGNIWILRDQKIFKWNDSAGRFQPIDDSDDVHYKGLNWDGTGFWGSRGQKLYCFFHGKLTTYTVPDRFLLSDISKVAVGNDGAVWLGLPDGRFARLLNDKWQLSSEPIQTFSLQKTRASWKISIDRHLDRTISFPSVGLQQAIRYNTIFEDDEHNVWLGSEGQGLYRIQPQTIYVYSLAHGLAGANIYPVYRDTHGDIWVGTWPAGLTHFQDGKIKTYTEKDGLPGLVTALAEDSSGNLWIGTHSGFAVLSQGHVHKPVDLPRDLPAVQAILEKEPGVLLLGTSNGIYQFFINDKQRSSWLKPNQGNPIGDVRVMIRARNGDIWFAGYSGLTRIHNGEFTRWTERDGLPSDNVRSIYEDPQGVFWIGTYDGGLGRYSEGHWTRYTQKNGLFDNGVFQTLEDSRGNLWMSSNRGIYRVSKQQLNDVAAGKGKDVITVSYGRADGMLNAECNGGLWPAGAKDKSGRLWFPTQDGVAVVEPASVLGNQRSPRVIIESADVDQTPANLGKPVTVASDQKNLEIRYTALSFSKPEQVAFRYKMDGLDSDWQDVEYRRTAYFSHLPPGIYTFRVMATNSDGVWSESQNLPIKVLPPFYRTSWFMALIAGLALAMIYALWRFKLDQLKEIQAAQKAFSQQLITSQESERRRISAELHDSLGQRLIIIKNHALFLLGQKGRQQSNEERLQTLEEINSEASLAIDETRTISYNLRPFQLDRLGLSKAIEALVRSASRATGIHFSTDIVDIDQSFPEDLRINFYRIVQEAVNNIIKHSGASEASIRVEKTGSRILLSISDNGKGFSAEQKSSATGKGGFGLVGIRERAAVLGGLVKIQGRTGFGATLTIVFDLIAAG
jgi:signal transduction histidine kinase/ligand-binding sensor domain-containing protein